MTLPQKRRRILLAGQALCVSLLLTATPASAEGWGVYRLGDNEPDGGGGQTTLSLAGGIDVVAERAARNRADRSIMLLGMFGLRSKFGVVIDHREGQPAISGLALQPSDGMRIVLESALGDGGRDIAGSISLRLDF